jgi:dihydroxyacetone kinase-like protein
VAAKLKELAVAVVSPLVGRYATSMEMAGMSFTFSKLDAEPLDETFADCQACL